MFRTLICVSLFLPLPAFADAEIRLLGSGEMTWESTPEGVAFASLDGDRFTGAYMAMVRLPAGTISPPHIKSANMLGVMLEGQMTHVATGSEKTVPQPVGPGGFYRIPAGLAHVSSCISDTPCVTVLCQDGAFDFLMPGNWPDAGSNPTGISRACRPHPTRHPPPAQPSGHDNCPGLRPVRHDTGRRQEAPDRAQRWRFYHG